jgi:hypothetical protein
VQDGLLASAIPFEGNPGPVFFGDGALIALIVTPADAAADVQQSGLGAGHSFSRFSAVLRAARHSSRLERRLPSRLDIILAMHLMRSPADSMVSNG